MCRIIALSGIDGSGKSTCIDIINSLLHEQGANKIVIYDSMNQGVFSEMLKHISSRRGIPFRTLFSPELINIVWMSDLIYIFDQLIKPAMADNDYIILHRSELCCRVYSRLFNPCSNTIDRCLDGFSFNYDLNIFLDIDPSIAYERICERKKRYPITEKESRKMLSEADRLYKKYLLLPPYCDMQRVNTGCSINNVESQLRKIINNLICDNHDTAEANVGKICTIIRETLGWIRVSQLTEKL